MYLDSLDSFFSINHESKEVRRINKSNERIGKVSLILIIAFVAYIVWTIIDAYVYGESDFVLEMNKASTNSEKLTHFAIKGQSYRDICHSGQCTLENEHLLPFFSPPTPEKMSMSSWFDFTLKDNIPNAKIGPTKQEYLGKFSLSMRCNLDDIIGNGQEIYTCHDRSTTVTRKFDSRIWEYDTNAIFDAKKNTLKAHGNYTGSR